VRGSSMGSINNGINYTIGFSDNFSAPLTAFSGAVGKVATDAGNLGLALNVLNPKIARIKDLLGSARGMGLLNRHLGNMATNIKAIDLAVTSKLNSRLTLLIGNLAKFETANGLAPASINNTTMALEKQAAVAGALATELGAVKANMTQIPNARKFRHLARANATLTSDATPYFVGGSSAGGGGSASPKRHKFIPPVPMYQTMGKVGQQLRNVGQGAFQSAMAMGFMAYPLMGVGGRGLEYTKDIEKMIRDAKLRSPDVQNNKKIETDLRGYLVKTYRENPFDRDKGGEILSTLGAYGISFKGSGGGFKGSLAQKFLELNIKGVEGLDMSPAQLAKAQSYMIANAKASGITKDNDVVKYVGDRMSYVNYLADTFGVLEKDILRGSNEKIRAAMQGISPKYNTNLDDDASAFSAWIQRGTGRNQSKATSVGTSLLNRLSQRSYLVGTDKQAGLFNEAQAQDIRSIIAGKGGIAGVQAFFKLRDANKKAMYQPFLKQGLGTYDAEGNFVRKKGLTDKQQSAISRAELSFKAREKKTIGEYGDTIGILGSKTNLDMLQKMLNPDQKVLASKGMDRVFEILKTSLEGKIKTLDNAFSGFASLATHSLMPSLMIAMDGITNFLNTMSNLMTAHPLIAKGFGATALAGTGIAVGTLGFGMVSNLVGSAIQGASLIGAGRSALRAKSFGAGRKVVAQRRDNILMPALTSGAMSMASGAYGFPMVNMSGNRGVAKSVIRPAGGAIGKVAGAGMMASGVGNISGIIARLSVSIPMLGTVLANLANPISLTVIAVGALSAGVLVLLSNLDGWKGTIGALGGLLGSLAGSVGVVFSTIGLAIQGLMQNLYMYLDSNPLTKDFVKGMNVMGTNFTGGINDFTSNVNKWKAGTAEGNELSRNQLLVQSLTYKATKGKLTDAEATTLNNAQYYVKKKLGNSAGNAVSSEITQRVDMSNLDGRLNASKNKLAGLSAERNRIQNNFAIDKFFGKNPNIDVKNKQLQDNQKNAEYHKNQIREIEALKAQKESTLKQTIETNKNTQAITALNTTLVGLSVGGSPYTTNNGRVPQPSPPSKETTGQRTVRGITTANGVFG
jgi:hypothetical protein